MPGLYLYQSLDMSALAAELANVLARPHGKPFHKDIIVIDGKGPSNWLTHGLIREGGLGVQMNADLLSTWRLTPWLCSILRDEGLKESPADPLQGLTSKFYALLSADAGPWKDYVGDPAQDGGTVLWDLCVRLTRHYRELLRNDADWIARAEAGAPDRWSQLWRAAIHDLRREFTQARSLPLASPLHEADVQFALRQPANRAKVAARLPGRLCLFSTGDIPRSHLQILDALRDVLEVNLFVLQPTEGFLGDLKAYEAGEGDEAAGKSERSASFRLLRSCGKHYALQQEKVIDLIAPDEEVFLPPHRRAAHGSLLGRLHAGVDDFQSATVPLKAPDASFSLHRCHGAWREAEVVRDQILAAFADPALAGLRQGDILILSPSPEVHAPLLAGVLGARDPAFAFGTAGLQGLRKSPVGNLVKALLELPAGRVTSLEVLGILGLDVVRDHTGWTDSELEDVETWFREAPFQWGIDASHRELVLMSGYDLDALEEGNPLAQPDAIGTLDEFLRRLSLGTAFGGVPRVIAGSLPLVGVDGQQALGLAAESLRVVGALHDWADFAQAEAGLEAWLEAFTKVTQALRPRSRLHLEEFAELSGALARMRTRVAQFGATPISLRLFAQLAEEYCDFEAGVGQFMTGKVTLAPLRAASIHPARLVILMGMNDGAFPQRPPKAGPEVVVTGEGEAATLTRLRLDAREDTSMHAFLLAVLAAKDRLVITFDGYVGSEGKPASAALPVEILRAAAQDSVEGGFAVRTHGLLSHHRPLPHGGVPDPTVRDLSATQVAAAITSPINKVLVPALPKAAADFTFAEWLRFWESPPRHALRQLSVHIPWEKKVIATAEPLQPDSEARRQAEQWVERCVTHEIAPAWEVAALTGFFPPSPEGETLLDILVETESTSEGLMLAELQAHLSPERLQSLPLEELLACELLPFKTDEFRLFVRGDTVGVICLGYFSESKHPYRWLMCLPAISAQVGRPLHRLFVTGVKPPSPDEVLKAATDGADLKVKTQINYLELPPHSLDAFRANLIKLMDAAVDEDAPLMPKTFATGVAQRVLGNPVKVSDSNLRSSGQGSGDADDTRARILIPEQYAFHTLAAAISKLIPDGVRRLTSSKVEYARVTHAQQLEAIAAEKRANEEKVRLAAEKRAAKAAAKAAAEAAGEPPPKRSRKSKDKKDKDLS
jgi:exodeoxyribonuclease V gamma subunit